MIQKKRELHCVVCPYRLIVISFLDALQIISSGIGHVVLEESNQIALFQQFLYFEVKRISSKHVPSLYTSNSVSSASGSIFQHQLVKQFQISTPTLAYSYSCPPLSPPSIPPSLPLSLLWSHFTVEPSGAYPNLSLGQGPKAVQGPPELSCELSTFPSAPFTR